MAYIKGRAHNNYRNSVRDPINPHITVPLGGGGSELNLTVPQALDLVADLITAVQDFNKRADVAEALLRTGPGPCSKSLGLGQGGATD